MEFLQILQTPVHQRSGPSIPSPHLKTDSLPFKTDHFSIIAKYFFFPIMYKVAAWWNTKNYNYRFYEICYLFIKVCHGISVVSQHQLSWLLKRHPWSVFKFSHLVLFTIENNSSSSVILMLTASLTHQCLTQPATRAQLFKTNNVVNISLKLRMLKSFWKMPLFFVEKCEKLFHCKSISHFFYQNISVNLVIKSLNT